ncbi:sulfatase family protein [Flagellimonas sp.]|uniref:sulfatase family protein n=1 Tax=Flagellimonas sp. TaxID=2058762 RepID=UPI003B517E6B
MMHIKIQGKRLLGGIIALTFFVQCQLDKKKESQSNQAFEITSTSETRPNVVIIYADDLGYGDVSCYNKDSKIKTPHIDKLAVEGMKFKDAHSAASYCTPSRYSILTGNYCWRSKKTFRLQGGYGTPIIQKDERTLGNLFQQNGYKTAASGKWHVGMHWSVFNTNLEIEDEYDEENVDFESPLPFSPVDQGFDYFFGTSGCPTDDPPFLHIENRNVVGLPLERKTYEMVTHNGGETSVWDDILTGQGYSHETTDIAFTDKAIGFMEEQTKKNKPFFVYLPFSLPHIPWEPAKFVKGSTGAGPRGDLVALLDHCVGEITSTLERLGVSDNTLIVFTSDNGPREGELGHRSAGEFKGFKGSLAEGGHRVPFIVKWPGKIAKASESNELIGQVDLYATLASILGSPLREKDAPDSMDFSSVLFGEKLNDPIRTSYIHHGFGVRLGDWKLIFDAENIEKASKEAIEPLELYNLSEDLTEQNNVIEDHPEIVSELISIFLEAQRKGRTRPI